MSKEEYDADHSNAEAKAARYRMVRHGYGLQIYNGKKNKEGVISKYEGAWIKDLRHGAGNAVFSDGSTYEGEFASDNLNGTGKFKWP